MLALCSYQGALALGEWDSCCMSETMRCLTLNNCSNILQEEEEDGDLSSELTDLLKPSAQMQSVTTSPVENSESDAEESQEKLTRELRLSSTRAASMYVNMTACCHVS